MAAFFGALASCLPVWSVYYHTCDVSYRIPLRGSQVDYSCCVRPSCLPSPRAEQGEMRLHRVPSSRDMHLRARTRACTRPVARLEACDTLPHVSP